MGSTQAQQATIDMTLSLKELQVQLQPEWRQCQMFNGVGYGLCIVPYLTPDSAETVLVPGAIVTRGAKRHMSFA
jgi:hypothetical protein